MVLTRLGDINNHLSLKHDVVFENCTSIWCRRHWKLRSKHLIIYLPRILSQNEVIFGLVYTFFYYILDNGFRG